MLELIAEMSGLHLAFWVVALWGSVSFLFIFFKTFFTSKQDGKPDLVAASDNRVGVKYRFLSFKNAAAFFTIFGWTGVSCIDLHFPTTFTLLIAALAGLLMLVLNYWMHGW